jgi:hypothetical protein
MALITALIFAEKALPIGAWVVRAAAVILVAYGMLVLSMPTVLPTMMLQAAMPRSRSEPHTSFRSGSRVYLHQALDSRNDHSHYEW